MDGVCQAVRKAGSAPSTRRDPVGIARTAGLLPAACPYDRRVEIHPTSSAPVNLLRLAESRSASVPVAARRSKNYTAGFTRFILSNTFAVMRCARGSGPFGEV